MNCNIFKTIFLSVSLLAVSNVSAQESACGMRVKNPSMTRNDALMTVDMNLDLSSMRLKRNTVAVFTPVIVNGKDSVALKPVGLYSRTRWFQYLRSGEKPLGGPNETALRFSKRPDKLYYSFTVPYDEWMNGSELILVRKDYGCCRNQLDRCEYPLSGFREVVYVPQFRYVQPVAEAVKSRELSGRAFVDFPVNEIVIYSDYHSNTVELGKIVATIDSVRNDKDITVSSLSIKGFASPEGSYQNNVRLAKGRTEALKQYVRNLYNFAQDFISTSYEPEDWEGLRNYVAGSGIAHRDEILAIIDSNLEPDAKNWKIKDTYPEQYRFLLDNVYPSLRHSDYTIKYVIRGYSSIDEIRETFNTRPQKLSLNEMYLLAQTYEPGSDEYNDIFETAVRMYPEDITANLNAANSAMSRNDLRSAEKYLQKAGNSAEATYARGVYAAMQGDYAAAKALIKQAQTEGLSDTAGVLQHLDEVSAYAVKK